MIRSNRTRRATLKTRRQQTNAAGKIRRHGAATLSVHCLAAGLPIREARTVASSLRRNAVKAGVQGMAGISYTHGRARQCMRYTARQVGMIARIYKPRRPGYRIAANRLTLAA
ncbi:hypothetical protein [Streptomyces sp. NPDC004376]